MHKKTIKIEIIIIIFFLLFGILFLFFEKYFYDFVDENGILQESLFLPIGTIFIILGLFMIIILSLKMIYRFRKNNND